MNHFLVEVCHLLLRLFVNIFARAREQFDLALVTSHLGQTRHHVLAAYVVHIEVFGVRNLFSCRLLPTLFIQLGVATIVCLSLMIDIVNCQEGFVTILFGALAAKVGFTRALLRRRVTFGGRLGILPRFIEPLREVQPRVILRNNFLHEMRLLLAHRQLRELGIDTTRWILTDGIYDGLVRREWRSTLSAGLLI